MTPPVKAPVEVFGWPFVRITNDKLPVNGEPVGRPNAVRIVWRFAGPTALKGELKVSVAPEAPVRNVPLSCDVPNVPVAIVEPAGNSWVEVFGASSWAPVPVPTCAEKELPLEAN